METTSFGFSPPSERSQPFLEQWVVHMHAENEKVGNYYKQDWHSLILRLDASRPK